MTELSFLIDLLLNGRLQKAVQEKVRARIAEVEQNMSLPQAIARQTGQTITLQSPSTKQAIALQNTTPIVAQALNQRNAVIQASINEKPLEVSTGNNTKGPRKF